MSTSLEERLYARELRALYRANRHSLEPFNVAQSEAFQREARRRARRGSGRRIRASSKLT